MKIVNTVIDRLFDFVLKGCKKNVILNFQCWLAMRNDIFSIIIDSWEFAFGASWWQGNFIGKIIID